MIARALIWLVLLICAAFLFGLVTLFAAILPIDDGLTASALVTADTLRGAA